MLRWPQTYIKIGFAIYLFHRFEDFWNESKYHETEDLVSTDGRILSNSDSDSETDIPLALLEENYKN